MQTPRTISWAILCCVWPVTALSALAPGVGAQEQAWIHQFGTVTHDAVKTAGPDEAGGVLVAGGTLGAFEGQNHGQYDAWLARYDAHGAQTWVRQFGSNRSDWALAAAADGTGGAYVAGHTYGSLGGPFLGVIDAWLARCDSAGSQAWIRQIATNDHDYAKGLASDGSGGVFITGYTYGSLGGPSAGGQDVWLARYDVAGNQTWIRQFGSARLDIPTGAAPDGAGGVFIVGQTRLSPGAPPQSIWLARYDGAGNQTWIRFIVAGTTSWDFSSQAASDGAGGVYVVGNTTGGSLGGPSQGGRDVWLARYDGAGNELWIRRLGSPGREETLGAAADGAGGLLLTGRTSGSLVGGNAGEFDAWIAQYDPAGNQTWIEQLGTNVDDWGSGVASDGSGGLFVAGSTSGSIAGSPAGGSDAWVARYWHPIGIRYCTPAIENSTGEPASLSAIGSDRVQANDLTLVAGQLPQRTFGYFMLSQVQDLAVGSGGSQGNLCLGAPIGRFIGPGQVLSSGATYGFSLALDVTSIPQPLGGVAIQPGESWNFQAWYRDANPNSTTNFTDAVSVLFL